MSDTSEDPQRPEGDLPQEPTAADWSPPPVEATQPIDPYATSAIPLPPPPEAPPTPPGNPYGPPATNPYGPPATNPYGPPATNPYAAPPANPYAAPPVNPYGAPPAAGGVPPQPGPPAYGQGIPPYAQSTPFSYQQVPQTRTNVSAVVLLILSGLTLLVCCLVEIPAVILAIVALTKQNDDPAGSRRLTVYGWIAFGVGLLIAVVVAGLLYANGFTRSDTPSSGYSY